MDYWTKSKRFLEERIQYTYIKGLHNMSGIILAERSFLGKAFITFDCRLMYWQKNNKNIVTLLRKLFRRTGRNVMF